MGHTEQEERMHDQAAIRWATGATEPLGHDEIDAGRVYQEAQADPDAGRLTLEEAWEDVAEMRGYLADALRALLALWQALNGAEFILGQAVDGLDEVLAQVAVGTEEVSGQDVEAALTAMIEAAGGQPR